jgi:hypothetical protein
MQEHEQRRELVRAVKLLDEGASLPKPAEVGAVAHGGGDRLRGPRNLAQRRDREADVKGGIEREDERKPLGARAACGGERTQVAAATSRPCMNLPRSGRRPLKDQLHVAPPGRIFKPPLVGRVAGGPGLKSIVRTSLRRDLLSLMSRPAASTWLIPRTL